MILRLNYLPASAGAAEKCFGLNVLIACEDASTVSLACEVMELVGRQLTAEERVVFQWWNFNVLANTPLRAQASAEAAEADMIIVAARDGRPLPPEVTDWMKRWLEIRADRPGALVAALNSAWNESDASWGMLPLLKAAAARAHLDFFVTCAKEGRGEECGHWRSLEAVPGNSFWRISGRCTCRDCWAVVGQAGGGVLDPKPDAKASFGGKPGRLSFSMRVALNIFQCQWSIFTGAGRGPRSRF